MSTEEAFVRVEAAVRALRAGRMAVVRDDAARENEGDLVLAAELATADALALMARLGGGLICARSPLRGPALWGSALSRPRTRRRPGRPC